MDNNTQKDPKGTKKPGSKKGLLITLICVGVVVLAALTVFLLDVFGVIRIPFLHGSEPTTSVVETTLPQGETTGLPDEPAEPEATTATK